MNFKPAKDFNFQPINKQNREESKFFQSFHQRYQQSVASLPRSPYLSPERIHVTPINDKEKYWNIADHELKRGKTSNIDAGGQPKRRMMKKSVLTLPRATCEPSPCRHCHDGVELCNKCKKKMNSQKNYAQHERPSKTNNSNRHPKDHGIELKSLQRGKNTKRRPFLGRKSTISIWNPNVISRTMTPDRNLSTRDVWNLLKEMNNRQYNRKYQNNSENDVFKAKDNKHKRLKRRNNAREMDFKRKEAYTIVPSFGIDNQKDTATSISNERGVAEFEKQPDQGRRNQRTHEWMCDNANRLANEKIYNIIDNKRNKSNKSINLSSAQTIRSVLGLNVIKESDYWDINYQTNRCSPIKTGHVNQKNLADTIILRNQSQTTNFSKYTTRNVCNGSKGILIQNNHELINGKTLRKVEITRPSLRFPIVILGKDACAAVKVPQYTAPQFVNMRGIWQYMIGWSTNYDKDNAKPNKYLNLLAIRDKAEIVKTFKTPTMRCQRKILPRTGVRKKDNTITQNTNYQDQSKDVKVIFRNDKDFEFSTVKIKKISESNCRNDNKQTTKYIKTQAKNKNMQNEFKQINKAQSELLTSSQDRKTNKNKRSDLTDSRNKNYDHSRKALNMSNRLSQSKEKNNAKIRQTLDLLENLTFYNYENMADITLDEPKECFCQNVYENRDTKMHKFERRDISNFDYPLYKESTKKLNKKNRSPYNEYIHDKHVTKDPKSNFKIQKDIIKKYFTEPLISSKTSPTTVIQKMKADYFLSKDIVPKVIKGEIGTSTYPKRIAIKLNNHLSKSKEALNAKIEKVLGHQFHNYDEWADRKIMKSKNYPLHQRRTFTKRKRFFQQRAIIRTKLSTLEENEKLISSQKQYKVKIFIGKSRKKIFGRPNAPLQSSITSCVPKLGEGDISVADFQKNVKVVPVFDKCPQKVILKMLDSNNLSLECAIQNIIVDFDVIEQSVTLDKLEETFTLSLINTEGKYRYKSSHKLGFTALPEQICSMWPMLLNLLETNNLKTMKDNNIPNAIEDAPNFTPPVFTQRRKLINGHINRKLCWKLRKKVKPYSFLLHKIIPYHSKVRHSLHNMNSILIETYVKIQRNFNNIRFEVAKDDLFRPTEQPMKANNLVGALKYYYTPSIKNKLSTDWMIQDWMNPFINSLARTVKPEHLRRKDLIIRLHQENLQIISFSIPERVLQQFISIISKDIVVFVFCRDSGKTAFENIAATNILSKEDHQTLSATFSKPQTKRTILNIACKLKKQCKSKNTRLAKFEDKNYKKDCPKRSKRKKDNNLVDINKVRNLRDFMSLLSGGLLIEAIDVELTERILTAVREFATWSNRISPVQALLLLLLATKPKTLCMCKFHQGLVQGIATKRIGNSADLEQECRLIELDGDVESYMEGDDAQIVQELYQIAKQTAFEYKQPFNLDSERTLQSLVKRRRKLNPSYLRVMAKYVGFGLYASPSEDNIKTERD